MGDAGFNPLHCGAVVASAGASRARRRPSHVSIPFIAGQWSLLIEALRDCYGVVEFQSPSLRGSGRFSAVWRAWCESTARVSIPFIAGQWSLLIARLRNILANDVSIPFIAGQWSLRLTSPDAPWVRFVSIPFIAGQWSLHRGAVILGKWRWKFQSPSLRGSGRFLVAPGRPARHGAGFQSPSLRGSGRFARRCPPPRAPT